MPTTQTPFSDYQIALMQAQRQQQLADALRQQSFQPIESYDSGVLKAPISYTQGLAKMLQAYAANKGQEKAIENMGQAYGLQYDMLRNMYGGGQPQTSAPPVPAGPTATDVQGNTFKTNTLPPYLQNQQPMSVPQNIPVPQNQPVSQGSSQPAQGMPSMGLRLPPGQTPESMASLSLMMPQVAGPLQAEWMKPDQTTLAAMNAGYTPQQIADIQRRTLEKGAYIAPLNLRPGNIPGDPYTGMPLPSAPAIGAAQATNAAMIERAKQSNTPITVQGPQGQPITGWAGTVLGGGSGRPQANPVPQTGPTGTGQTPLTQVPNYGSGIQGQTTVGKEYAGAAAKAGSEYESSLNDAASNALTQNKMLDELQKSFNDFTPGKAAAIRKSIAEWKVQTGLANANDQKIAASGEVGDKLTGQLVSQALRTMSARPSQMEFQIFLSKFVPNLEMTPQGAQQVIQFMRQQNNLPLLKQQAFSQTWKPQHTPDQFRDFETYWNQQAAGMPLSAPQSFGAAGTTPKSVHWNDLK